MQSQDHLSKFLLQSSKRAFGKLIVLSQGMDKTIASVGTKPERITGEEIRIVYQIDHMSPSVAGAEKALNPDSVNIQHLPGCQQNTFVIGLK